MSRMKDIVIAIKVITSIPTDQKEIPLRSHFKRSVEKNEKLVAATLKDAVEKRMEERGLPQHYIEVTVTLDQPHETVKAEEVPPS